jgi:multidrug efflux pump subunit AcrB
MATCHAEHKFFIGSDLGQWSERSRPGHVFNKLGIKQENNDGLAIWDWSHQTKDAFKDYRAEINKFIKDVTYLNNTAPSLLETDPFNLPTDGTDLRSIENVASQIIQRLGNLQEMKSQANETNQIAENLAAKINEAKAKGIDVSGNKHTPETHSEPTHSSSGYHGGYGRR